MAAGANGVFPWGWLAADRITALALLPNGNILLGFDNLVLLREYNRMGVPVRDWATSGPGQISTNVRLIVRIQGGDLVVRDVGGKRFSTSGDYLGPINLGPYFPFAASATRLFCATASDLELHVLTLDGQHVAQFGAGVIGIAGATAVDGDTIYVADTFGQYIEKFAYSPVAITPATWSRVKAAYK